MAGSVVNDPRAWTHEGSGAQIQQILNTRNIPGNPNLDIIFQDIDFTNDVGGTKTMAVDGSSTPAVFTYAPATDETHYILAISMFLEHKGKMDADAFGAIPLGLSTGWVLEKSIAGTVYQYGNFQNNMELINSFDDGAGITPTSTGLFDTDDAFSGKTVFGLHGPKLVDSRGDFVRFRVRDDLTSMDFLQARVHIMRFV